MHFCGIRGVAMHEYMNIQNNTEILRVMRHRREFTLIIADGVDTFPYMPLGNIIVRLLTKIMQMMFAINFVLCTRILYRTLSQ